MLLCSSLALAGFTATDKGFLPVLSNSDYVLLSTDVVEGWVSGAPTLLRRPGTEGFEQMSALAAWTPANLPATLSAWKGRTLHLKGPEGVACTSKVAEVQVVDRLSWMDGYVTLACETAGPECDASLLEQLKAMGNRVVAARLETSCPGATVAHVEDRPIAVGTQLSEGKQRENALAQFRALSGHAAVAKAWMAQSDPAPTEAWDSDPTVTRFALGDRVFVTVSANAGICTGLDRPALFGAWEVKKGDGGRSWVELTAAGGVRAGMWPYVLGDGDGDGMPELFGDGQAAIRSGARLGILEGWEWPWIGCVC